MTQDRFIGLTVGRYRIDGELHRSPRGTVYRGRQVSLDRPVAIEVLAPQLARDADFVRRFRQEAELIAGLSHENVVYVHDVVEVEGTYGIVMESLDGQTLHEALRQRRLSPGEVVEIGIALARALDCAHGRGVVHRDVASRNVLMTPSERIKLMGFGLARTEGDDASTRPDTALGTADYRAPEQSRGGEPSPLADIYSLGVLLYELATGELPFAGQDEHAVSHRHIHEQPRPPRAVDPSVPAWLEGVILKAMAKDPAERFQSAAELEAELLAAGTAAGARRAGGVGSGLLARLPGGARWGVLAAILLLAVALGAAVWRAVGSRGAASSTEMAGVDASGMSADPATRPPEPEGAENVPPEVQELEAEPVPAADAAGETPQPGEPAERAAPANPEARVETPAAGSAVETAPADSWAAVYACSEGVEFHVDGDALVAVDGEVLGIADDWDGTAGGRVWRPPRPGTYSAQASLEGYRTTWVKLVLDPRADEEICEVDVDLPEL